MRGLLAAVAVWVLACGGAQHPRDDLDDDKPLTGNAFDEVHPKPFTPTSFVADVRGEGRPVILIPGLGCPGSVWDETVAHLAGAGGYQTHVLSLAGFAGQPRIAKPLSSTVRKELVRYIKANRLKRPIIVGHSLGGVIAYWLAATAPELIGGVVVVDAGPALSDTDEETAENLRSLWSETQAEAYAQQVHDVFVSMGADQKRMEKLVEQVLRSDREAMGDAVYELTKTDLRGKVSAITAPVLLVLADGGLQQRYRDEVTPIPHVDVHVVPHTRHFVMFDDPKAFFGLMDDFLGKLRAAQDK